MVCRRGRHRRGGRGFSAVPRPTLDTNHRLVIPDQKTEPFDVLIDQADSFFAAHRTMVEEQSVSLSSEAVAEMRTRPLRVGDVFAMSKSALLGLRDPETAAGPRGGVLVFDVSREAREAGCLLLCRRAYHRPGGRSRPASSRKSSGQSSGPRARGITAPTAIPEAQFRDPPNPGQFLDECRLANQVIYFLLNVGDGDTQLILLPGVLASGGPWSRM